MKKVISISLVFIFLLSASGFSINTHYCNGKLKYIDFVFSHDCKSCCGTKKMPKGCCKNKTEVVKIKDHFISEDGVVAPSADITTLALVAVQKFDLSITKIAVEPALNYLYPPDKALSLPILFRSILI